MSRRAALLAIAVALAAPACVSDAPRATPGTTALAAASFCDPMRALSVDAWSDTPPRSRVVAELAAARAHAPVGLHAALETLIDVEQAGGPAPDTRDRWFAAMSTLSDVVRRECNVDVNAGAPRPTGDATPLASRGSTPGTAIGSTELTFDAVVDLVRVERPGSRWVDQPIDGAVGSGDAIQVSVAGVADDATAMGICTDLLAVLPTRVDPPNVIVRNPTGLVVVAGEAGECALVLRP